MASYTSPPEQAAAPKSGTQTPPNPNSKKQFKMRLAKAEGKTPKAKPKKDGTCSFATGSSLVASGNLIKGGVLGMLAAGANAMCEKLQSVDHSKPAQCHTWMC